jgi:hypothetical protein
LDSGHALLEVVVHFRDIFCDLVHLYFSGFLREIDGKVN